MRPGGGATSRLSAVARRSAQREKSPRTGKSTSRVYALCKLSTRKTGDEKSPALRGWLRSGDERLEPIPASLLPWVGVESRSQFEKPGYPLRMVDGGKP